MKQLVALMLAVVTPGVFGAEFHVSPGGDDAAAGTRAAPFATPGRAREAVRELTRGGLREDVTVYLADGVYRLAEPLRFGPEDGGTAEHSVTWTAVDGARPVLAGGVPVTGWRPGPDGTWVAEVPGVTDGSWNPRILFVNGVRAQRARYPNAGAPSPYLQVRDAALAEDRSVYTIGLDPAVVAAWGNMGDVEIVVCGNWEITRKKLAAADPATGVLTLAPPHAGGHDAIRPAPGRFCFLENAAEFLDEDGEWYLDRSAGLVTYRPRPGETLAEVAAVMPRLTRLVEVKGVPERPVRNLHLVGLTFREADWAFPEYGFNGAQAAFHTYPKEGQSGWEWFPWLGTGAALTWEFAQDCSLRGGVVSGLGGCGVHLGKGCHRNVVEGNLVEDVGANGIMVGENLVGFDWEGVGLPEGELPVANRVSDNIVRRCGVDDYGAVGIWVSFTDGTDVSHNEVYDLPYTGISVGWEWVERPTGNRNNRIEYNHVRNVLRKLCDGGCLYTLGRQPGTVIRGNLFHDALRSETAQGAPNNGIFFDQGSMGFHVQDNVIYATSGEPIRFNQCQRDWHTWGGNRFGMALAAPGKAGAGLLCDGASSFVEVPHEAELDPAELTVEAWVCAEETPTGDDPRRWLVNKNANEWQDGHWALMLQGTRAGAYLNIGGGPDAAYDVWSEEGVVPPGEWRHLAFTYDGADLKVYADGVLVASREIGKPRSHAELPLAIGRRQDAYSAFRGVIDEVILHCQALRAPEIAARFRAAGVAPPDRLPTVRRWSFEDRAEEARALETARAQTGPRPGRRPEL